MTNEHIQRLASHLKTSNGNEDILPGMVSNEYTKEILDNIILADIAYGDTKKKKDKTSKSIIRVFDAISKFQLSASHLQKTLLEQGGCYGHHVYTRHAYYDRTSHKSTHNFMGLSANKEDDQVYVEVARLLRTMEIPSESGSYKKGYDKGYNDGGEKSYNMGYGDGKSETKMKMEQDIEQKIEQKIERQTKAVRQDVEKRMKKAFNKGVEKGMSDSYDQGYADGKYRGYDQGYLAGCKTV